MSNNFERKPLEKPPSHRQDYSHFNEKRTRTYRAKSQEFADSKKFAQEYAKITQEFKSILGVTRRDRVNRLTDLRKKSIGREHQSAKSIGKVSLKQLSSPKQLSAIAHFPKTNSIGLLANNGMENTQSDLFVHLQEEKNRKINHEFAYVKQLVSHFENLYRIREDLDDYKNNYENIVRSVKKYVFNFNGSDVSKLDDLLKIKTEKWRLRMLLCLEKVVVLGVMDSMIRECEVAIENEGKLVMDVVIGVYYSILSFLVEQEMSRGSKPRIEALIGLLDGLEYQKRKDLLSTNDYLQQKIPGLFRFNQSLMAKIKQILSEAKLDGYRINKVFYHLLSEYARNINEGDLLSWNRNLLDSFATCPSPHLAYSRQKTKYTVVLQLEGVLCLMKTQKRKSAFRLRPYATELVTGLSKAYEVVLFTNLMPEQLSAHCQLLNYANALLFKYHTVRYQGTYIKDLSRLGRKPTETILIDDQANRNMLAANKDNTLIVRTWMGSQADQQLLHTKRILLEIANSEPQDVRACIAQYQERAIQKSLKNILQADHQEESPADSVELKPTQMKESAQQEQENNPKYFDQDKAFEKINIKQTTTQKKAKVLPKTKGVKQKRSIVNVELPGTDQDEHTI